MVNQDKIYIGKTKRLIVEQTIGDKIWELIAKEYEVKRLIGNGEDIILIEEKSKVGENN